jgi:hypothetical protein
MSLMRRRIRNPPHPHPRWRQPRRGQPFIRVGYRLGETITVRGQVYFLLSTEPYTRKDGSKTKLAWWLGQCSECGWLFVCTSPCTAAPQRRRCDAHKRVRVLTRPKSFIASGGLLFGL